MPLEHYTGCLMGLAIGDALGAPLEGMKSGHIAQIFPDLAGFADSTEAFPDRPGKWRMQGLYTDDTQQALAVAEMLAVHHGTELKALVDLYLRMASEGPPQAPFGSHRGTGHFFRRAVQAMRNEADPRRCGQPSAGNGAAMRIAPVGLFLASDADAMARAAIEISLLTHHDIRAISAALAMARAIGLLVPASDPIDPPSIAEELARWVAEWEEKTLREYSDLLDLPASETYLHAFSETLSTLPTLLREGNLSLAEKTIIHRANCSGPTSRIAQAHDGFAVASVAMALYRALSARDFTGAILETVRAGGDADTVGAMVGALLGARFGESAIPEEWRNGLLNAKSISERARALFLHEVDWTSWDDLPSTESELTARELQWIERTKKAKARAIEKREQRQAQRREHKTAKPAPETLPGFVPPPETYLGNRRPPLPDFDRDPRQVKKEKALRGHKRIEWKEERRRKKR